MEEERINELEENIKSWREELDTVWKGKETDVAEVERRNLRNLIKDAEREINKLKGIEENEISGNPEELLEELKNGKESREKEKRRLELSIERLEEEKEAYASQKNTSYKDIYKEYEEKIEGMKKELEEIEGKEIEGKDEKIKVLTQGRMKEEREIREIERKIRQKEQEISEIEYGTEEALEEKELEDGTKVKVPKVLNKYRELDELKKSLKDRTVKKEEYQKYINELKGIEKEEKTEYTPEQNAEYTKYFHGQGDIPEKTRNDKRGNDEYFGFEKSREGKKTIEPVGKEPPKKEPTDKEPVEKEPTDKDPKLPSNVPTSGLQIFRREFNNMPEILKKHTFSENPALPLPGSLALALATAGVVTGPVGWIGAAGVAAVSYVGAKPILRKITGQSKLEKQITEQFNNMDTKDLKMMADYLTEENIINLKPNAVILRALNKSMRTLANRENEGLQEEIGQAKVERDNLLSKKTLTESEIQRLDELTKEINLKEEEMKDNEVRSKNARRGRERVSAAYKGNVGNNKILNVFHRRNSTTKQYKEALNEYADAELEQLIGEKEENVIRTAKGQAKMEEIGDKYTYSSRLGILKSPFNMPQDTVRIVSDQKDNTIRNIGVAVMTGAALKRTVDNMLEMQKSVQDASNQIKHQQDKYQELQKSINNISDKDIKGTGENIAGDIYNRSEAAAVHANGTVSRWNPEYVSDDQQAQNLGDAVSSQIDKGALSKGSVSDKLRKLGDLLSGNESKTAAQNLQDSVQNSTLTNNITGAGVDHTQQFTNLSNVTQNTASNATLYKKLADVIEKAQSLKPVSGIKEVVADFVGPIAAAVTSAVGSIGIDAKRNYDIKKSMQVKENEQGTER